MTRWHRPVRLLLAVFAIVFAVGVYFSIGRRARPSGPAPQTQADREAVVVSTAGEVILFKGSQQDVRIEHQKRITYQSGRTKFFTTKVTILDRGERNFEVTADEAEVAENQSAIDMRGNVVITVSDGLTVKTDNAIYTQSDETMRAPGPVAFSRGRMTGTSVGATYDKTRDVLWLVDQARIVVTPDEKGAGGVDVTAGRGGLRAARSLHALRARRAHGARRAGARRRERDGLPARRGRQTGSAGAARQFARQRRRQRAEQPAGDDRARHELELRRGRADAAEGDSGRRQRRAAGERDGRAGHEAVGRRRWTSSSRPTATR